MQHIVQHDESDGVLVQVTSRSDLSAIPKKAEFGGYVYLIEFSSGNVKVGQSVSPDTRMNHHYGESIRYGDKPERIWISPPHGNFKDNETAAIKVCTAHGKVVGGREYFHGRDLFDTCLPELQSLIFEPGGEDNFFIRKQVQDELAAYHAQFELKDLKKRLGETPDLLLHLLGMLFHESGTQKIYDWEMGQETVNDYDRQLDLLDTYIRLADLHKVSVSEFLQMDRLAEFEHIIHKTISLQIEVLRMKASHEGKYALLEPIRENIADAAESVGL